jgi:hypothetical protein
MMMVTVLSKEEQWGQAQQAAHSHAQCTAKPGRTCSNHSSTKLLQLRVRHLMAVADSAELLPLCPL